MGDLNTLLKSAINETKNLKEGESFLVKDLFKGYLWNRIPRGDRLLLGSMFMSYVSSQDCTLICHRDVAILTTHIAHEH